MRWSTLGYLRRPSSYTKSNGVSGSITNCCFFHTSSKKKSAAMSLLSTARFVQRYGSRWSSQYHSTTHFSQGSVATFAISRNFASPPSSPPTPKDEETTTTTTTTSPSSSYDWLRDANPKRIRGIRVNPDSIGSKVLPGNLVYKKFKYSGNTRKIPLEIKHGYFWMMRDLQKTGGKPTLTSESLIPEEDAQIFPVLTGLKTLSQQDADLPFFFVDENTPIGESSSSSSPSPTCTLVAISFRDSGYKLIPSWTDPFEKAFEGRLSSRARVVKVSITERWSLYPLRGALSNLMRQNTPPEEHDKTLLYFGSDVDDFRDVLRMHNIMTNYIFLLDDSGRIRFAASGEANEEDVSRVIQSAKTLTAVPKRKRKKSTQRSRQKRR